MTNLTEEAAALLIQIADRPTPRMVRKSRARDQLKRAGLIESYRTTDMTSKGSKWRLTDQGWMTRNVMSGREP